MSFVSPAYLAFLLLVPVLIALYFRKSRPMRRVVPSSKLWDQVLRRLSNNSLFHRYRHSLFLVLQLIVLVSLVLGLSRPHLKHSLSGRTILVLDTSASMRATDVAPSRFAKAREDAQVMLGHVDSGGDVAIVTADSEVVVRAPFGGDIGAKLALLRGLEATDHPGPDLGEVLAVVETLQRQRADRVEVFTDQLSADELVARLRGAGVTVHALGSGADNVAITRFDIRSSGGAAPAKVAAKPGASPAPPAPPSSTSDAEVQVTSFAPQARMVRGKVELAQNGVVVGARPFELARRGDALVRFEGLGTKDGVVEARLAISSGTDLLEADNHAWGSLGKQAASVLLLGHEHGAMARALRTIPGLSTTVLGWQQVGQLEHLPAAEITVAEDVFHPDLLGRNALILAGQGEPGSPAAPWLEGGTVDEPVATRFENTHPVLKYLSLKDVTFRRGAVLRREPGDVEVLGASATPLILARTRGAVRHVVCAFTTNDTDFSLRVGFPIFVMNALRWVAGSRMDGGSGLRLGEPYALPAGMSPASTLTGPDGRAIAWQALAGATGGATATQATVIPAACFPRAGLYVLADGARKVVVPATLSSFGESSVAPAQLKDVSRQPTGGAGDGTTPAGLARWMIGLALTVMIAEWALYARMGG